MKAYKGLIAEIYRAASGYDCSLGAPSSKARRAIIVGPGIPEIFEAEPDELVLQLTQGNLFRVEPKLVQVQPPPPSDWMMFGGNYAGCSDSRFSAAVAKMMNADGCNVNLGPSILAIHDRYERN